MKTEFIVDRLLEGLDAKDLLAAYGPERHKYPVRHLSTRDLRRIMAQCGLTVTSVWRAFYGRQVHALNLIATIRPEAPETPEELASAVFRGIQQYLSEKGIPDGHVILSTYPERAQHPQPRIVVFLRDGFSMNEALDPKDLLARVPRTAEEALRLCQYQPGAAHNGRQVWSRTYPLIQPIKHRERGMTLMQIGVDAEVQWPESQHGDLVYRFMARDADGVILAWPRPVTRTYAEHREDLIVQLHTYFENITQKPFDSIDNLLGAMNRSLNMTVHSAWRRAHGV